MACSLENANPLIGQLPSRGTAQSVSYCSFEWPSFSGKPSDLLFGSISRSISCVLEAHAPGQNGLPFLERSLPRFHASADEMQRE